MGFVREDRHVLPEAAQRRASRINTGTLTALRHKQDKDVHDTPLYVMKRGGDCYLVGA